MLNANNCWHFNIYEQEKIMLSWAEHENFYNLGAWRNEGGAKKVSGIPSGEATLQSLLLPLFSLGAPVAQRV